MKDEEVIKTHAHTHTRIKQALYLIQEKFRVYRNFRNEN